MKILYILLISIIALFASCKNNQSLGHDHGPGGAHAPHETEDIYGGIKQEIILKTASTEVFFSCEPFVIGKSSKMTIVFTRLENIESYKKAKVSITMLMSDTNEGIKQTNISESEIGHYTTILKPKEVGIYSIILDINSSFGNERIVLKNIEVYKTKEESLKALRNTSDNEIAFSKEQVWKLGVGTTKVKQGEFISSIRTTGELVGANNNQRQIVATTSGIIEFASNNILSGKRILRGEKLFNISGGKLVENNANTRYTHSKTEFTQAKSAYDRASKLIEDKIISEKEFISIKANYDNAKVKFDIISKNSNAKGMKIKAPFNGFISRIFVNEGQYVEQGSIIAMVNKNQKLIIKADIYPNQINKVSNVYAANFVLPGSDKVYKTENLNGKLISYGKDIDKNEHTSPLYFEIDRNPELYSGAFVEIYLLSHTNSNSINIPETSIMEDQGVKYVFVQVAGEKFEKRFIKIGTSNGVDVEITKGLAKGEVIVNQGVSYLKLASLAGAVPASAHSH